MTVRFKYCSLQAVQFHYGRKSFMLQAQVKFNSLVNFLNRLKLAGGEILEEGSAKFGNLKLLLSLKLNSA